MFLHFNRQPIHSQEYVCKVSHHLKIDDHIYYSIIIISTYNHSVRAHKMRYSDLQSFHEKLCKQVSQLKIPVIIPQFPSKKWFFGGTNNSIESISSRVKTKNYYIYSSPTRKQNFSTISTIYYNHKNCKIYPSYLNCYLFTNPIF